MRLRTWLFSPDILFKNQVGIKEQIKYYFCKKKSFLFTESDRQSKSGAQKKERKYSTGKKKSKVNEAEAQRLCIKG